MIGAAVTAMLLGFVAVLGLSAYAVWTYIEEMRE
jgi:hypothetical protein|tara:strand:- start:2394 stop:2495 length:102 start_codon:yes stop_codon:yes gene_type:complete